VPPYTGPKGWLGVELDKGLSWETINEHVREAYAMAAPAELVRSIAKSFRVKPPTRSFRTEEIDPFKRKTAKTILKKLEAICAALPETEPGTQFGAPVWKAGKKTFVSTHYYTGRLNVSFWVGAGRQAMLTKDHRYRISPYTGRNGWIDLDVEEQQDWNEIKQLAYNSYRKFALKRMLQALEDESRRRQSFVP
jgi:predicted DNA-binding protein (MmcQ/YjbR family)